MTTTSPDPDNLPVGDETVPGDADQSRDHDERTERVERTETVERHQDGADDLGDTEDDDEQPSGPRYRRDRRE